MPATETGAAGKSCTSASLMRTVGKSPRTPVAPAPQGVSSQNPARQTPRSTFSLHLAGLSPLKNSPGHSPQAKDQRYLAKNAAGIAVLDESTSRHHAFHFRRIPRRRRRQGPSCSRPRSPVLRPCVFRCHSRHGVAGHTGHFCAGSRMSFMGRDIDGVSISAPAGMHRGAIRRYRAPPFTASVLSFVSFGRAEPSGSGQGEAGVE